jgi:PKHD-type hydroxylase
MITIENFLSNERCKKLREEIARIPFHDGRASAVGIAAKVKNNLQMDSDEGKALIDELARSIMEDQRVVNSAFPKEIARIFINRYDPGMVYGAHSDAPYIGGLRTDVSFTIFLEDPAAYDGGELVLRYPHGTVSAKPGAGSMVLYSTGVMHRVEKVTRGSRLACVGWIRSYISDQEKREILRELKFIRHQYLQRQGHDFFADLFLKNISNLERIWGE